MTRIFDSYKAFLQREDKDENGINQEFADNNPEWEKQNETNKACWNCSDCSRCSGCSDCSDCSRCSGCSGCSGCSRCSGCSGCSGCCGCSRCSGCSGCSRCSGCSGLKENAPNVFKMPEAPVIKNIHTKVFEAASREGALDMLDHGFHKSTEKNADGAYCGTTHCRAGWAIALAGKAGIELESIFGSENAAMQIYKASSNIPVSPVRFYEKNEIAMADIERCALLEAKQ